MCARAFVRVCVCAHVCMCVCVLCVCAARVLYICLLQMYTNQVRNMMVGFQVFLLEQDHARSLVLMEVSNIPKSKRADMISFKQKTLGSLHK